MLNINNDVIDILLDKYKDHQIADKLYKYINKGGNGIVYKVDDMAIKIYVEYDMDTVLKEFYVMGILQELSGINRNIINIYNYYLSLSKPVLTMEYLDGDLQKWTNKMIHNKFNLDNDDIDKEWISMIFQVTYGMLFLNKLGILHNDAKPKNIMYNNNNRHISSEYKINGKTYTITSNFTFKIADFGGIMIVGSTLNDMTNDEIKRKIKNRSDLWELSRIFYRVLTDYAKIQYKMNTIMEYVNNDGDYYKYYSNEKNKIWSKMKKYPIHIKESYLLRSLIYYGLENNIIDIDSIINTYQLKFPSKKVLDLLSRLIDTSITDLPSYIYQHVKK